MFCLFLLCSVSFSSGDVGHVIDLSSQQIRGSFSLFFLSSVVQMYRILTDSELYLCLCRFKGTQEISC